MIAAFFIKRPVFACVLSIIIILAGLISLRVLPVSQYPSILPTDITVSARYPGASAEVIANTVASPLEEQINGVQNMIYMNSNSSSSGQLSITVSFAVGTDPAQAEIDVNNRVQAAIASLPQEVRDFGVTVSRRSGTILEVIALFSPDEHYSPLEISNYALLNVIDELKRIDGVGDAALFGAANYAMRIWLKPDKMSQYNITPDEIQQAIQEQNSQFALGNFGKAPTHDVLDFSYTITTKGRFSKPQEFEDIIIRATNDASVLKLRDVATVELGAEDYSFLSEFNSHPAIAVGIYLQTGANALSTTEAVRKKMLEISAKFPQGLQYDIPFDTTKFVRSSIEEVIKTFAEALILVIAVVYLFLQNARATLIPLLAVPVSLIGTFSGMYMLGFSINLLTLFGLIVAIGIVVDDAIVVLENVQRIMYTQGLPPKEAAIKAMEEVSSPVIAIALALCAVFLPIAFMGGLTGIIYKQFAVTIAISVILSAIVALTLTPALCAHFLQPIAPKKSRFFIWFNNAFTTVTEYFTKAVSKIIDSSILGMCVFFVICFTAFMLYKRMPTALVPEEDQGYLFAVTNLMPATSLDRTKEAVEKYNNLVLKDPTVANIISLIGFDLLGGGLKTNSAASFVVLKDWAERTKAGQNAMSLVGHLMGVGTSIANAMVAVFNPPPITGMSRTGGFEMYLQYKGDQNDPKILETALRTLTEAAASRPELAGVQTTFSANAPRYYIELDRIKARALNIPISAVFNTMQSTFGTTYVNDFSLYGHSYKVYIQSEAKQRQNPDDLRNVYVRSNNGNMIPLSSLITVIKSSGLDNSERFNTFPSGKVLGNAAPGYSSGQAITAMEDLVNNTLSKDFSLSWIGAAYQQKVTSSSGSIGFIFGIIMVYLILAALYERWSLPLSIIAVVPFAILGAVLLATLKGVNNDVYFQIGMITLIGLSAKNAILIVEFAVLQREKGLNLKEAAVTASRLRLRPIIMTSLAFIFGCLPLYFSTGAGAASRHSVGAGIIGGMLTATFVATFFIPLFFKVINVLAGTDKSENSTKQHKVE